LAQYHYNSRLLKAAEDAGAVFAISLTDTNTLAAAKLEI